MVLVKRFRNDAIELQFSIFHFLYGNPVWFCRIWRGFKYTESYGKNKFQAFKKASQH